ncbi:methylated-DNA--[protein]-cysteine S-methyltransferase [Gordonia sp. PP30]|uniref:methylated-DNA--[protein]-cysteine S-methyltransferase n=1 Tax=unclassified Gordonia (in: high G+C Gram-positive bacteria) TaxID=2657482 RepID=UPI0020002D0B|nr:MULTISPECIES: methylated-DNA--[protein]-cysteine S-methyltransferase [unclassified Gordonia (in: high G+C Gram-positive bacteria)]UQE74945.1 methylated-DNA--[protein]-cysteine S-methyltransferase [Gordonia sp. PP30]
MPDLRYTRIETPLREVTLVAEDDHLTGLYFPRQRPLPAADEFGPRVDVHADPVFTRTAAELAEYFDGTRQSFGVPLRARGDDFAERVWALLRQIPYGTTTTYGAIATRLGHPGQAQRVGQTVGRNPIGILIPCHRVIGADGSLTGYAGGLDRKRRLLDLEEPADTRLF